MAPIFAETLYDFIIESYAERFVACGSFMYSCEQYLHNHFPKTTGIGTKIRIYLRTLCNRGYLATTDEYNYIIIGRNGVTNKKAETDKRSNSARERANNWRKMEREDNAVVLVNAALDEAVREIQSDDNVFSCVEIAQAAIAADMFKKWLRVHPRPKSENLNAFVAFANAINACMWQIAPRDANNPKVAEFQRLGAAAQREQIKRTAKAYVVTDFRAIIDSFYNAKK